MENETGKVVVAAKTSDDDPHPGLAFMVKSPWSNQLQKDGPADAAAQGWRGISARVSPAQEKVTEIAEIVQRIRA